MKKLILISLLTLGSSLLAADIGIRVQTPIGNNSMIDINFRSDDHRNDTRYRNFDYQRNSYYDNYGYYYGYFDRYGYFYNNIYFDYDSRYTYYDRLHHRGHFKPNVVHYRTYKYHKHNDWNKTHQFREHNKPIYGPYYEKRKVVIVEKHNDRYKDQKNYNDKKDKNYKDNSHKQDNKSKNNNDRYKEEKNYRNQQEYNKHNR
jgi:hypothetical protein